MPHPPLFIVGLPACGKSTFGRALAKALGRQYIDLDSYVQNRFRATVAQIFAARGEEEFRRMEAAMLREVGEFQDVVISTGGGAPCFGSNMDFMLSRGHCVWLQAPAPLMVERIMRNSRRPMFRGLTAPQTAARLQTLAEERVPHYARAGIHHHCQSLECRRDIDAAVAEFIRLHPGI